MFHRAYQSPQQEHVTAVSRPYTECRLSLAEFGATNSQSVPHSNFLHKASNGHPLTHVLVTQSSILRSLMHALAHRAFRYHQSEWHNCQTETFPVYYSIRIGSIRHLMIWTTSQCSDKSTDYWCWVVIYNGVNIAISNIMLQNLRRFILQFYTLFRFQNLSREKIPCLTAAGLFAVEETTGLSEIYATVIYLVFASH